MDHDHKCDHKAQYIHGVLSLRENKALVELDAKIQSIQLANEVSGECDLSQWTQETSAELYDQFVANCCCADAKHSEFSAIRQALIIKDYETARPLIASHTEALPECVALVAVYDYLKS